LPRVLKLGFVGAMLATAGKASYDYLHPINTCSPPPIKNMFTYGNCPEIFPETTKKFIDSLGFPCTDEMRLSRALERKVFDGKGDDVCRILAACPDSDRVISLHHLIYMGDVETIRFLVENGILEDICESRIQSAVAHEDPAIFKLLIPLAKEKSTQAALVESARLGKLAFIKTIIFGAVDVSSAIPSALIEAATNGHLSSVKFLAKNKNIEMSHVEQALLAAAQKGRSNVIRYLCKEYSISLDTLNSALEEAAFMKHKDAFVALVQGGVNFFSSEVSADYAAEIEMLPSEGEIVTLSSDSQFKFFVAHINQQEISPSMLKILQSVLVNMTQEQQGILLENLLAHQKVSGDTTQWIVGQMPDLSEEYQLRVARLALLKGSSYESFRDCLNEEQKNALKKWEGRVDVQNREMEALRAAILRRDKSLSQRPSRQEWQKEVERQIELHFDQITALARKQIETGIHVYKNFAQQIYVVSLDKFPGLIFKIFPKNEKEHKDQYERATRALEVCEKDRLNRLRIPYSLERLIEVDDQYVSIEEKLEVLDHRPDYQARVQFMSRDPELSKILRETFRQATIFVSRTGWHDTRFNNAPLLKDGTGMGLVDIDRMGFHPQSGLYRFQTPGDALIDSVPDPRILKDTVLEMDYDRFRNFDFDSNEAARYKLLACQERQREVLLKRGLMDNDPIPMDPSFFQGLSPLETKAAEGLIKVMNRKLENRGYDGEPRGLYIDLFSFVREPEFKGDKSYYKDGTFNLSLFEKVIERLQQKEVIFYKEEDTPHRFQVLI